MKNKRKIQQLQRRYDYAREKRLAREEAERPYKDRIKEIFDARKFVLTDFWCEECKRDCTGTGYRQVCTLREKVPTAWYIGFCPLGHRMVRRITDKDSDPYYFRSMLLQRQRYELRDMLLTPDNPRFKELYPKQWEELQPKM